MSVQIPTSTASRLAATTGVALTAAVGILLAFVLPAEYGIDPLGTGRLLGLTAIASPPRTIVEPVPVEGAPLAPVARGPIGEYPAQYKLDVFEVTLEPYEYIEYKYQLERGATMVYAWQASAPVIHDFHGERTSDGGSEPAEQSFDKSDRREASGSFAAPFAGIHGWYWENPGADPIHIRLASSGFYAAAVEIRSDRTRIAHQLMTIDSLFSGRGPR